jgi:hypothetical protein
VLTHRWLPAPSLPYDDPVAPIRPLPDQDPFPGADILYVHDRASYQAVITKMRETLGELGRDGAEHQAL